VKASLKIEAIADNSYQYVRLATAICESVIPGSGAAIWGKLPAPYWVAEITGLDIKYRYARRFLKGTKDFTDSNSVGSRGIYVYYVLESGRIYEILAPTSWRRSRQYFARVDDNGQIIDIGDSDRVSPQEVLRWVNDHSALTS
jgi:hypothetical protein